jgi:bifunctional UDP-N-acetylglucosamine pyrophosphorylase / glucosamine-1-phosphate N-acetyltransferase
MSSLLVIPAAGLGTRLKSSQPKALVPVNGRPMLDHLVELYASYVDYSVIVAHPSFADAVEAWADEAGYCEVVRQPSPTGMLDAILLAAPAVMRLRPDSIWITWCDQVGVLPATVQRLADASSPEPPPALAFPTVRRKDPYIHFARDRDGRIVDVLHRREGDVMPDEGESDMGLFALSRAAFDHELHRYASEVVPGKSTGERNFLPFIAWLSSRAPVVTFPCTDPMEAVGINTPEELQQVEEWLRRRVTS